MGVGFCGDLELYGRNTKRIFRSKSRVQRFRTYDKGKPPKRKQINVCVCS
jgi:hypothetical protein